VSRLRYAIRQPSRGSRSTRPLSPIRADCVLLDAVDLNIGKPERPPSRALDDSAVKAATWLECETEAARRLVAAGAFYARVFG
jgi:hypothetical protein